MSMCQVSFSEPGLLSRRRERKLAYTGLSRERPGDVASAGFVCSSAVVATAAGAVLGAPLGYFTLAIACVVAVVVHRFGSRRAEPIAFAPYIAALTGVALPLGITH